MSPQAIEPHYSTPLLALVSAIMDFPAPQSATSDDYDALIRQIDQLCPLQHFGMLGLADTGLNWLYAYKISDIFNRHSAPDLGINLPIALTQYLQNDLLVSC